MSDNPTPVIFLSYSRSNKAIVDIIDNDFQKMGYVLKRDIRDAPYRSDIISFMQEAATADYVIVVISHEYLISEYCMYEALQLLNTQKLEERILPIVLDNAKHIYNAYERKAYYDLWRQNAEKARLLHLETGNADFESYAKRNAGIFYRLDDFFSRLIRINFSSFDLLKAENYRSLLNIIGYSPTAYHQHLFADAFQAFENRRYKEARELYEHLLSKYPDDGSAHFNLGLLLQRHFSDYTGAKYHYEESIRHDPSYSDAHVALIALLGLHFSIFLPKPGPGEVRTIDPKACEDKTNLADTLSRQANYDFAKWHYEQALKLYPGNARTYNNLAVLLSNHFRDDKTARLYYETALRLDPKLTRARTNLTNLLAKRFRKNWWDDIFG